MNKIKDDEPDINAESEGYKTDGAQWWRPMKKQVTDAKKQKWKITLAVTFKTEFGRI